MISSQISRKLAGLRVRESSLRFLWGVSRWLCIALLILCLACLLDWVIDSYVIASHAPNSALRPPSFLSGIFLHRHFTTTPFLVRLLTFLLFFAICLWLIFPWLVMPMTRKLSDEDMALMVEQKHPHLQHRLISILQFHRKDANTVGMSQALIYEVTKEAEQQTARLPFSDASDHSRLKKSAFYVVPPILIAVVLLFLNAQMVMALVSRQFLFGGDIPRSVQLASIHSLVDEKTGEEIRPKYDEVLLEFKATGAVNEKAQGLVFVYKNEGRIEDYPLTFDRKGKNGELIFASILPAGTDNFEYRAWLGDGRSDLVVTRFEPRPVIGDKDIFAWSVLPETCGTWKKKGEVRRFEEFFASGDIQTIPDSDAHVRVKVSPDVRSAWLDLYVKLPISPMTTMVGLGQGPLGQGPLNVLAVSNPYEDLSTQTKKDILAQKVHLQRIDMELSTWLMSPDNTIQVAAADLHLPNLDTEYTISAKDKYDFANTKPAIRDIKINKEPTPSVQLLPGTFLLPGSTGGAPTKPGGRIRVSYNCEGPYGVGMAELHYRITRYQGLPISDSDTEPTLKGFLPLKYVAWKKEAGPFRMDKGTFANNFVTVNGVEEPTSDTASTTFHTIEPAPAFMWLGHEYRLLGFKRGGGRFDYFTNKMSVYDTVAAKDTYYSTQAGDQIEFFVKVYASHDKTDGRPFAISDSRVVMVKSAKECLAWTFEQAQEFKRLKNLESKQQEVEILDAGK